MAAPPSLRENWEGAALFVAPHDAAGLRCAIEELAANPGFRVEHGLRARQRGLQFTPEGMAAGYLELYRGLVHGVMNSSNAKEMAAR